MILIANKPLTCCECGATHTPQEMKSGEIRMHQIKKGILCEFCFENFKDASDADYEP